MIICPKCGTANKDNAHYCKNCGALLTLPAIQSKAELDNLKNLYANTSIKLKTLESTIKEMNHELNKVSKISKEAKRVREASKRLDLVEDLEKEYERKIKELKVDVDEQIKDAKYYKLRALTRFREQLDDISTKLRMMEREENSSSEKVAFINQKLEKELKNLGNVLEARINSIKSGLDEKMNVFGKYNRNLKEIEEKINGLEKQVSQFEHLTSNVSKLKREFDSLSERNSKTIENVAAKFERDLDEILAKKANVFTKHLGFRLEDQIKDLNRVITEKLRLMRKYDNELADLRKEIKEIKQAGIFGVEGKVKEKLDIFTKSMEEKIDLHIKTTNATLNRFESQEQERMKRLKESYEAVIKDIESTLNLLVKKMDEKISSNVENRFRNLDTYLANLQSDVAKLKLSKESALSEPLNNELKNKVVSLKEQIKQAALTGSQNQIQPDIRVRQLERTVRTMDSRIKELESLLKRSMSNMPIVVE